MDRARPRVAARAAGRRPEIRRRDPRRSRGGSRVHHGFQRAERASGGVPLLPRGGVLLRASGAGRRVHSPARQRRARGRPLRTPRVPPSRAVSRRLRELRKRRRIDRLRAEARLQRLLHPALPPGVRFPQVVRTSEKSDPRAGAAFGRRDRRIREKIRPRTPKARDVPPPRRPRLDTENPRRHERRVARSQPRGRSRPRKARAHRARRRQTRALRRFRHRPWP